MDERPTPTVFRALWLFRWSSLLIVLCVIALSVGFGFLTRPSITATAKLVLATPGSADPVGVVAATEPTFVRYVAQRALFVTSSDVLGTASKALGNESVKSLRDHVTSVPGPSGGAVLVTASAPTAARAAKIANAVADAYRVESTKEVADRTQHTLDALRNAEATLISRLGADHAATNSTFQTLTDQESTITISLARFGSGVTFSDPATAASAVKPKLPYLDGAIGLAVGLLIAGAIAWVRADRRSATARTNDAIYAIVAAPNIGEIPRSASLHRRNVDITQLPERSFQLAWVAALGRAGSGVVLIAGPEPSEGRSTAALHLAAAAARDGYRVLLVDSVPRKRGAGLTNMVDLGDEDLGFEALVCQDAALEDVVHQINLGEDAALHVVPVGEARTLPVGVHRTEAVGNVLSMMRDKFDVVLVDTAPSLDSAENAALARHADHVILVVKEGGDRIELERFTQRLSLFDASPVAYIVNFMKRPHGHS